MVNVMCAYQTAKKHFSRDDIIDILNKNVDLYKNEPNFASYIVDLTLYLVEYGYKKPEDQPILDEKNMEFCSSGTRKFYKVFRAPATGDTSRLCPFCGALLNTDSGKCYQCGNFI